jgi:23S rRNA-/tRNA-specific pseudouridylate synthase
MKSSVDLKADPPQTLEPRPMAIEIHYEDEDFAVIENLRSRRPSGSGNREQHHRSRTAAIRQSVEAGGARVPASFIGWMDFRLLIVAKNDWVHAAEPGVSGTQIQKTYIALVHAKMREPAAEIALNIGRH